MKSGVAALVTAVADHVRRTHDCRGVQVVLTAGEETGCDGALAIPRRASRPGGPLVVAEPTANRLVPAHKGAHWMRLSAHGKAAHGSAPELGDNAVVRLARAAVALHDFDGWPAQDGFGSVTANVGLLRGGVQPNVVPDAAELLLDVRTVPSASGDAVRDLVRSLAGEGRRGRRPRGAAAGGHATSATSFVHLVGETLAPAASTGRRGSRRASSPTPPHWSRC